MLKLALLLRFVTLIAALGAGFGSVLMFWLGAEKLFGAVSYIVHPEEGSHTWVIAAVMQATDAFLFGLVLIVFAYGITFGFAFDLPRNLREKLPPWMRIQGISELKNTLIEIILVYLIVDFATDVAEMEGPPTWDILAMPVAILLIAGTLRLLRQSHAGDHAPTEAGAARPAVPDHHKI